MWICVCSVISGALSVGDADKNDDGEECQEFRTGHTDAGHRKFR